MNARISKISDRITIMIDKDLAKRIRKIQAKKLMDDTSTKSVSFSSVFNGELRKHFRM